MKAKVLKKAALGIALGACIATMAPLAMAQSATGAVAGRASAGDQITITNTATGASRTVTVEGNGSYRLSLNGGSDHLLNGFFFLLDRQFKSFLLYADFSNI